MEQHLPLLPVAQGVFLTSRPLPAVLDEQHDTDAER
jgi:hypothetical protein